MWFSCVCFALCSCDIPDCSTKGDYIITYKHQRSCSLPLLRSQETQLWHPLVWIPKCVCLMLFKACLCKYSHLSLNSLCCRIAVQEMSRWIWTPPPSLSPPQNHLAMLKCTLSVTRYKGPCFAPFGEAAVSEPLSVKNAHLVVYVIFCANMCFVYRAEEKVHRQTKHEVEKIWFWWSLSGQLETCAFLSVLTVLR